MGVKSAFLYGTIGEEVYVHQPPSFVDPAHPKKVYKVVKALYGLHQAPRAWYETLSSFLLENGFRRDEDGVEVDVHEYRSMIGSLIYLTASRPYIMFDVCACASCSLLWASTISTSQPSIPSPPHPSPPYQSPPYSLHYSPPHLTPHLPPHSTPHSTSHYSPTRSYEAPLPKGNTSGSAEDSVQLKELMVLVPKLVNRIGSLEKELKETKQTLGNAVLTLVKKVKTLEVALKRKSKKLIMSESEGEEPEDQGRIIQDIDDDPLVSLV
ncbi:putative ribonuclease H-like domain-containing protein, partial [Tanacetum coccineum]